MLTRTARVTLNTLANYLRFGISLIVFFLLTPFIIAKVGQDDFGLWSLSWAVANCLILLDFGFGTGVVRYVAECKGRGDSERRNRILSTLVVVYSALALLGAICIYALSTFSGALFSIPPEQWQKAIALLWILGARTAILGMPLGLFRGVLFGDQRLVSVNAVQAGCTVLYALAAWAALARGMGVVTLAWLNLAAMVLEHLGYIGFSFFFMRDLRISLRLADWKLFKEVTSFSAFAFIASLAALVLLRTDPIIVKLFLPLSAVAVYAVALRIAEQAQLFTRQFTYVLGPFIAELKGTGDEEKIRFVLVNSTKFALAPSVVLAVMVYAFSHEALLFWVGPRFSGAAPVLAILASAMALSIPTVVASDVFTMTGNPKVTACATGIGIVLNIGLSVALVRPLGLIGVALGSLIATAIVDVVIIIMACKMFGVRYWDYIRRVFVLTGLPALLQLGATYGLKWWMPPTGLMMIAWQVLPGAFLYLIVFWKYCVEPSEKLLFAEKLLKWRRRPVQPIPEKAVPPAGPPGG